MTGMNQPPTQAMAVGSIRRWKDGRNMPDVHSVLYYYGDLPVSMRLNLGTSMPETYRQQHDVAWHQSLRRLPVHLQPYRARGHCVTRRAVLEQEIESPRLVRVDVRENAPADSRYLEHVGERVHA